MAPEFFMRDPVYQKGVDVWSYGCVVFELLHLKRLFAPNRERAVFDEHCPEELRKLVTDCTKGKAKERLNTDEVLSRITQIRDSISDSCRLVSK